MKDEYVAPKHKWSSHILLVFIISTLLLLFNCDSVISTSDSLKKLSTESLREVNGQEGLAFQLNDWQIDGGDLAMTIEDPAAGGGSLRLSNLRVYDPSGLDHPDWFTDPSDPDSDDRLQSGSFGDPFQLNITEESINPSHSNSTNGFSADGIIALDWPTSDANFDAADIGIDLHMNDNWLGSLTVGNALWAEGTQLEVAINSDGGIGLGISLRLDGNIILRGNYPNDLYPARGGVTIEDLESDGLLTWASLDNTRPLTIDFSRDGANLADRTIVIERVWNTSNPGAGGISFDDLSFGSPGSGSYRTSLGSSDIGEIRIRHFRFEAPLN